VDYHNIRHVHGSHYQFLIPFESVSVETPEGRATSEAQAQAKRDRKKHKNHIFGIKFVLEIFFFENNCQRSHIHSERDLKPQNY